ncbi:MAG TPA: biotin/lipoyl-binding protein [Oscillospiraceae bacterium]|nr:biotin/lipoyl-binding protein [Oscillospiraceae bacterium]HPS34724.1 biotin/lipoyl-binding protein [Oscillospiraceae bacterium]
MKKIVIWALSFSLLLGLMPGCSQRGPKSTLTPPAVSGDLANDYVTRQTIRGDIKKTIKSTTASTYRSTKAATAYYKVSGTIKKVNIEWGAKVKAGDVLATLVEAEKYKVDLAKAKQELDVAEIKLNQAKTAAEGGGEVALAQLKWQQAQNDYESSKNKNEQLRLNAEMLKATYDNLLLTSKNNYSDFQYNYQILKDRYNAAQAKYDACFIKAPISGEITWLSRYLTEGAAVKAYEQAATVESNGDLTHIYNGSSSDSAYLSAGDVVTVITDDDVEYQGRVLFTPDTLPGDINYSFGGSGENFPYIIKLIGFDYSQKGIGDNGGDLVIVLQDHKNAVLLESYLLKSYKDENNRDIYYVNVLINGVPIKKPITIGIKNNDYTEVTSGLDEGAEVIYIAS